METLTLRLRQLFCYFYEESDGDEVFLKINGKKVWPVDKRWHHMKDETVELNLEIPGFQVNDKFDLEVWDFDYLSPNDYMGKMTMLMDKPGGPYTTDMQLADPDQIARYSVTWEIIEQKG